MAEEEAIEVKVFFKSRAFDYMLRKRYRYVGERGHVDEFWGGAETKAEKEVGERVGGGR